MDTKDKIKPNPELFDIIEYSLLGAGYILIGIIIILKKRK